jgi:16S rRNA C967 or C1407 C5-methylase (RsmB/RsmF family)/NOL1/NOP2/fmu family ribosome biogenesis protein
VNLSTTLLDSLADAPGIDIETFVAVHESEEQVHSIRVNPKKPPVGWSEGELVQLQSAYWNGSVVPIPWNDDGRYLSERPKYTLDPLLHAGAYYVQEASSMFVGYAVKELLGEQRQLKALDLCAAPGGKSTVLAASPSFDLVLANEVISNRVSVLYENVVKWGSPHVLVSQNDPADFQRLPEFFDLMLVDAPCSGSGLFRRDPDAMKEWSPRNVEMCNARQQRILHDALPALKENGILIYSTCSFSKAENEDILDVLVREHGLESVALPVPVEWGIVQTQSDKTKAYGYRFYPDKLKGEGFFMAVLRNAKANGYGSPKQAKLEKLDATATALIHPWLKASEDLFFIRKEENLFAFPAAVAEELQVLAGNLNLRKSGLRLGQIMKNSLVPEHELALSGMVNESVSRIEMDRETALRFLRKENFLPPDAEVGWSLVTFKGLGLGWMKVMPNRANNYYPVEWRIRS